MSRKQKRFLRSLVQNVLYAFVGFLMIYPLLWMAGSSFKSNDEIFNSFSILPQNDYIFSGYVDGWNGVGDTGFSTFFQNSFMVAIPNVLFTLISCTLTAYGFARFHFPGKNILFTCMLGMLMLPTAVIMIPTYIFFKNLKWLNTFLPLLVPSLFATNSFIIFMLVQFFRGLPTELDEAARIDGCGPVMILIKILLPLTVPALITASLFQFMWTWNDFYSPLIYLNSVSKYTVALGLRMSMDASTGITWNKVLAMALVSISPLVILFFFAQRYFVDGIATSGLKG